MGLQHLHGRCGEVVVGGTLFLTHTSHCKKAVGTAVMVVHMIPATCVVFVCMCVYVCVE